MEIVTRDDLYINSTSSCKIINYKNKTKKYLIDKKRSKMKHV